MDIYSFVAVEDNEVPIEPATVKADAQHENENFEANFKIVAEIRPQDAYFLQKTRGATVVPTYALRGKEGRIQGSPLSIKADNSKEFSRALRSSLVTNAFPKHSHNKALEIVY
tara:strand:+ start:2648 stop:2986 length:339 start_codon:yes stop_codon:yes gene_type:complete